VEHGGAWAGVAERGGAWVAYSRSARSVRTQIQTSMITSYGGLASIVLTLVVMGHGRVRWNVVGHGRVRRIVLGLVRLIAALQEVLGPKFKHQ
jgi:hypothetical protein